MQHQNFPLVDECVQKSELELQNELDELMKFLERSETSTTSTTSPETSPAAIPPVCQSKASISSTTSTAASKPNGEFWLEMFEEKNFDTEILNEGFLEGVVVEEGNVEEQPVLTDEITNTNISNILGINPFANTSNFTPHPQDFLAAENQESAPIQKKFIQIDFSQFFYINSKAYLVKFNLQNLVLTFELNDCHQYVCDLNKNPSFSLLETRRDQVAVFDSIKIKLNKEFQDQGIHNAITHVKQKLILILTSMAAGYCKEKKPFFLNFYDVLPIEPPKAMLSTQGFFNPNKRKLPEPIARSLNKHSSPTIRVVDPSMTSTVQTNSEEPSIEERLNKFLSETENKEIANLFGPMKRPKK